MAVSELLRVEDQLAELLGEADEASWPAVARLLGEVEERELWRQREGVKSYSAWLRGFAQRRGCSESLLWKDKKAGAYWKALREADPGLPDLGDAGVSARSVATVEKICGADAGAGASLAARVVAGEVRSGDLQEMWRAQRKVAGVRKSRHDAHPQAPVEGGDAELTMLLTRAVAAQAEAWVWGAETAEEAEERMRAEAPRQFLARDAKCVRCLTEFPVRVVAGERPRRIDVAAVVVENITTADWMEVALRGVEVKVSEYDLERDGKMGDYALFMDYMSVAVPDGLVERAAGVVPPDWGVMAYDRGADRVRVVREPQRLDAERREEALMTACVKLAQGK